MNKLIDKFKESPEGVKAFLLYAYFAGMAFFIVAWFLELGIVEMGVVMGLFSALLIEPILETSEKANKAREIKTIFRFKFAINILLSVAVTYVLVLVRYWVVSYWFMFDFEPVSFGLLFASVRQGSVWLFNKLRKRG